MNKGNIIKAIKMRAQFYIPWGEDKIKWCAGAYEGTDSVILSQRESEIFHKVMNTSTKFFLERLDKLLIKEEDVEEEDEE